MCFRFAEFTEKKITACTPKTRTIPPKNVAASEADFGTGCEVRVRGVAFTFHSVQKAVVLATLASKQETAVVVSQLSGAGEVPLRSGGTGALVVVLSKARL